MDRKAIYRAGIMAIMAEKDDDISMMEVGRINRRQNVYDDREFLSKELKMLDSINFEMLVEQQIPKDPIRYTKLANDRFTYLCPNCNRKYMDKVFLNEHCDSCGQKLNLRMED